jgi:hypothetical protein
LSTSKLTKEEKFITNLRRKTESTNQKRPFTGSKILFEMKRKEAFIWGVSGKKCYKPVVC